MIKRLSDKQEYGDNGSSDSSSSFDSAPDADADEDHRVVAEEEEKETENYQKSTRYSSPGSGYESEDSSNYQSDIDASGLLTNDEGDNDEKVNNNKDSKTIIKLPNNEVQRSSEMTAITIDSNDPIQADFSNFILKYNSVFKCRLCPRILCLNETTLWTHLSSKRHARSKKLLGEGRLKLMLNSNGELEEEQETHTEKHARIVALSQKSDASKKDSGHQRHSRRRKKRLRRASKEEKSEADTKIAAKKRRMLND